MRILITGASGFIGLPIVQRLESQGHALLALSRKPVVETKKKTATWLQADLASFLSHREAIESFEPEAVIHLAWQDIPDFSFEKSLINLNQSLELLAFIIGLGSCRKILVSGSCWELNRLRGPCPEDEIGTPHDDFTWAKHALRAWLDIACKREKINLGWMRIFYVYGPRQRSASLIPSILSHLKNGRLPDLRTPHNANDFIFVDDVAAAFSSAVSSEFTTGIYNLGSGTSTPVLEVCRLAEQIVLGSDVLTRQLESNTHATISDVDFWADCSRAQEHLGWYPTTNLAEGIKETWRHCSTR